MSQTAITLAFEQWKAQQGATGEPVVLDEFVFASVPGLDPDAPIDRNETLPAVAQIVHREAVSRKGVVNDNAVVHSVVLGADVGDFSFNWIGLINKTSGTLAMIVHAPVQQKLKTKEGQQGNVLTRSFLMEYNGAQAETGINTPAETWQIDFTARLTGMDERVRQENVDVYGNGAFLGNGFLVVRSGNSYSAKSGVGYVGGLRNFLEADHALIITTKPVKVWVDTCFTGTLTSAWQVKTTLTVAEALANYVSDGIQHYVFAIAQINEDGSVTDLRPKGSLSQQQGNSDFLRKDSNLEDLKDKSKARDNLELGSGNIPYFSSLELMGKTPFIDFHYNSDAVDFTDRLISDAGGLSYAASDGRKFTFGTPVVVNKDLKVHGLIASNSSRVTGQNAPDVPGMTTDWNPVSGLTAFTNNRGSGAGGFLLRTVDDKTYYETGQVLFDGSGNIVLWSGKAQLSKEGNIYGVPWGVNGNPDWLSTYLSNKFAAIPINNITADINGAAWGGLLSAHLAGKWGGIQAQFSAIPVDNGSGNIRGNQWGIGGASDWLSNYINRRFSAIANELVLSGGQNGRFRDVTTGFLVQFGRLQSVTAAEETSGYNVAFPNQCLGVLAVVGTNINAGVTVYASPVNNQGFAYKTSAGLVGFTWFAWGY